MKKKLLIFHSALAPYRINFFNKLSEEFSATIVFLSDNLRNQNFNRANLLAQITFTPHYLKHKIVINDRDINFGYSSYIFKVQPDSEKSTKFILFAMIVYKCLLTVGKFDRFFAIFWHLD